MAQTKRKRQTKHRGNAAGIVETRGRTGRPPSAEEKKAAEKSRVREQRMTRKPTWLSATYKAAFASVLVFAFVLLTEHTKSGNKLLNSLILAVLAFVIYLPSSYYLEIYLWKRRTGQVKRAAGPSLRLRRRK